MILSDKNQSWEKLLYLCQSNNLKDFYKNKKIVVCKDCKFVFYKKSSISERITTSIFKLVEKNISPQILLRKIKELRRILKESNVFRALDIACRM